MYKIIFIILLVFCMLSCSDINIDKASDESLEIETVTSETEKVIEETVTEAEKIEEFVEATEVDYDMEFDEYVDSKFKDIGGEHMCIPRERIGSTAKRCIQRKINMI